METTIRKIGNSRGIIIPQALIEKYKLKKVNLEESDSGILLTPVNEKSDFAKAVDELRKTRDIWYTEIEKAANDPETIAYYKKEAKLMGDVDIEIIE